MKPSGFWVTDDDAEQSWLDFCLNEDFALDRFEYRTPISLAENHNVLIIRGTPGFQAFEDRYMRDDYTRRYIDWVEVARDYDGLIITPYLWSARLSSMWYYGWDCASGCIWNADAIIAGESQPFRLPVREKSVLA